jgi:hypothetical protein
VWLESDSQLVLQAFKSNMIIPWSLRNKWYNCLVIIHNMRFFASHIYSEVNVCADGLANFGLTLASHDLPRNKINNRKHTSMHIIHVIAVFVC